MTDVDSHKRRSWLEPRGLKREEQWRGDLLSALSGGPTSFIGKTFVFHTKSSGSIPEMLGPSATALNSPFFSFFFFFFLFQPTLLLLLLLLLRLLLRLLLLALNNLQDSPLVQGDTED